MGKAVGPRRATSHEVTTSWVVAKYSRTRTDSGVNSDCQNSFHIEMPHRNVAAGRKGYRCSFSFARPKENEPKEKDAPRKFFTSRATPPADDFVGPACFPTCSTKSFTASTDGTKFSQGFFRFLCVGQPKSTAVWVGKRKTFGCPVE